MTMKHIIAILFIIAIVRGKNYLAMEINEMETEDLNEFFGDDSERYLLLAFRGENCPSCRWQLFYPNLLTYFFEAENDLIFGVIDTDKSGRAGTFCDVDPESAKLEIRLITKGGTRCMEYLESQSLTDFVTESTGKIAKKSYVSFHNIPSFEKMKANTAVSHFIEIMSPFEKNCYDFSIQVEKAAEAFAMEPAVDFNRIDCSLMHELCEQLEVTYTPAVMFYPADGVAYNNTYPRLPSADSLILYINDILGTHRTLNGGLDEDYGRDPILDEMAIRFIDANEEERKEMMQTVKNNRKQYINSALYYGVMKDMLSNGNEIIFDRINSTVYSIEGLSSMNDKYAPAVARLNILHQFEPIIATRSIVMSPQNTDRVLNGKRNVMVLFYDIRCPICRDFAQVFRDAFDKHPLNVYFASVNAARYETLRIRFNVTDHPILKYFAADEPLEKAVEIPERSADGIVEWMNNELARATRERHDKENAAAAEMASHIDDDEEVVDIDLTNSESKSEKSKESVNDEL